MLPQEGAGCEKGQSLHKLTDGQTNSIMAWKRPKTKKKAEGHWTMVSQHAVGEIGRIITQLKITLARTPLTPRPTVSPSSGKPCLHQARRLLANSSSSTTLLKRIKCRCIFFCFRLSRQSDDVKLKWFYRVDNFCEHAIIWLICSFPWRERTVVHRLLNTSKLFSH